MTPELFPEDVIATWLDAHDIAPGAPMAVEQIAGGRSNVMFRIARGHHRLVLRRPAKVAVAKADDGMRREFRVLRALADTDVPHPRAIAIGEDPALIGCVFYVMEEVDGVLPLGPAEAARAPVTMAVTDALAVLHDVDWRGVGLTDFGKPEGFHERQVSRWTAQFEGYRGRTIPEVALVGAWLDQHLPAEWTPSLIHADYHMMNVLIAPEPPPRVLAIVDWETATIGDPLLDLAGFCEVWCGAFAGDRWPARDEIVERYRRQRGLRTMPDLRYYEVLYNFRLGILLEGVYQRSRLDNTRDDDQLADERAMHNLHRAAQLIDGP